MYCVKCGVKLQEGTEKCPLCGTPVWNPDGLSAESTYSSRMPDK
ncbi:MAG: zinc-ribbon domain-containing protein, partial [Oscillospiraceae bacterium]|nr:zinc-ribbon domain-containing protein [Oscillospiraceae bacterium]